ncbi:MAG: ANTAR domain-containing protein [Tindallia sp. MSAO_Bac2]|nr:MAG: ANTAR domain-containing protein [Tindallia sp. MSAO_Bac2]
MKPASILIAMQQKESIQQIRQLMQNSGYRVAHSCHSGNEVLQAARSMAPDILIVNETLPDFQGLDLAEIVIEDRLCAVILLASPAQKSFAEKKMNAAYFVCLTKPVQGTVIETSVEMLLRTSRYFRQLEKSLSKMEKTIQDRKVIDKAKGLMMEKLEIGEEAAYNEIRKKSMDTGKTMSEIAEAVIELLNKE